MTISARYLHHAAALEFSTPDGAKQHTIAALGKRFNALVNRCMATEWSGGRGEWTELTKSEAKVFRTEKL